MSISRLDPFPYSRSRSGGLFVVQKRTLVAVYAAFALLLVSLQSFYFANGAWFCLLGLVLLARLIRWRASVGEVAFFLMFSASVAVAVFSTAILPATGAAQIFSASAVMIVPMCFRGRPDMLTTAMRIVIRVHLTALFGQAILWAVTGQYFDVLARLGMMEQVYDSAKGLTLGGVRVPRFAGLANEPGTYATLMAAMLAALFALERRVTRLMIFGGVSILMTLSLGGMLAGGALLGAVAFGARGGSILWGLMRALLVMAALGGAVIWIGINLVQRSTLVQNVAVEAMFFQWVRYDMPITASGIPLKEIPSFFTQGYLGAGLDVLIVQGVIGFATLSAFVLGAGPIGIMLSGVVLLSKVKLTYPLIYVLLVTIRLGHSWHRARRWRQSFEA